MEKETKRRRDNSWKKYFIKFPKGGYLNRRSSSVKKLRNILKSSLLIFEPFQKDGVYKIKTKSTKPIGAFLDVCFIKPLINHSLNDRIQKVRERLDEIGQLNSLASDGTVLNEESQALIAQQPELTKLFMRLNQQSLRELSFNHKFRKARILSRILEGDTYYTIVGV
jgi:hypothetical protein